jgi:hypothetical protein
MAALQASSKCSDIVLNMRRFFIGLHLAPEPELRF